MEECAVIYSIASDFPAHTVCSERLSMEISATALSAKLGRIDTNSTQCGVCFHSELTTEERGILDAIVANHSGVPIPNLVFHASTLLVGNPQEVHSVEWETVSGVVTNAGFFVKDIANALGRIVGQVKVSGTGAEIRILKRDNVVLLGPVALSDTANEWGVLSITTTPDAPLDAAETLYTVEARLGAASSLQFRYCSFALLELCS